MILLNEHLLRRPVSMKLERKLVPDCGTFGESSSIREPFLFCSLFHQSLVFLARRNCHPWFFFSCFDLLVSHRRLSSPFLNSTLTVYFHLAQGTG